jgi:quercetin dioxygenase-like cupin family protein
VTGIPDPVGEVSLDPSRVDFESAEWLATAPGARHKFVERGGKRIRLVEFADTFVEHDWCPRGHVGYLLQGEMEIAFEGRTERLRPGEGFIIRSGTERHRARALTPVARMILIEDV